MVLYNNGPLSAWRLWWWVVKHPGMPWKSWEPQLSHFCHCIWLQSLRKADLGYVVLGWLKESASFLSLFPVIREEKGKDNTMLFLYILQGSLISPLLRWCFLLQSNLKIPINLPIKYHEKQNGTNSSNVCLGKNFAKGPVKSHIQSQWKNWLQVWVATTG